MYTEDYLGLPSGIIPSKPLSIMTHEEASAFACFMLSLDPGEECLIDYAIASGED